MRELSLGIPRLGVLKELNCMTTQIGLFDVVPICWLENSSMKNKMNTSFCDGMSIS